MRTLAIALALIFILASCINFAQRDKEELLRRGYPASYADGWYDGYGSGERAAGNPYAVFAKDVNRYLSDQQYKSGWDDSFAQHKGQYEAVGRSLQH